MGIILRRQALTAGAVLAMAVLSVAAAPDPTLLVEAVKQGDAKAVRLLLAGGSDVNAPTVDGSSALHWAVYRNNLSMVDQLLRAGANVSLANGYDVTPISMAAESGNAALIERLLKGGADPNTRSRGGEPVLMTAAQTGNVDAVRMLLAYGANPNAAEPTRDQTVLMWAAARGNTDAAKVLIETGAKVNVWSSDLKAFHENTFVAGRKDADSRERMPIFTPFLFAVRAGHIATARVLLDAGANMDDKTPSGMSALHLACINAHWELAANLLDWGADPRTESDGGTALHHIADVRSTTLLAQAYSWQGNIPPPDRTGTLTSLDLVKKLIAKGADVNARIRKPIRLGYMKAGGQVGMTPLMMTATPADPEYMRLLLANGADPTLMRNYTTLLMAAAGVGGGPGKRPSLVGDDAEAMTIVKMAVALGLDINAQNDDGDTALHGAVWRAFPPLVQYLVDQGAKLDAKNKVGWTPLMEAHLTVGGGGLLTRRPEIEALLRPLYEARGLSLVVPTREEAEEKLGYLGGPVIACPEAVTVQSSGGRPTVINYGEARAATRRGMTPIPASAITCTPRSGSEFPVGATIVSCTASDTDGRTDACTLLMRVLP